jgi:tight adherence protein C
MEFLIIIGAAGLVGGFTFLLLAPKKSVAEPVIQKRLEAIVVKTAEPVSPFDTGEETFWERVANFFLGDHQLTDRNTKVRRLLHQAGYARERSVRIFWGIRIFVAMAGAAAATLFGALSLVKLSQLLLMAGVGGALGYLLPHFHVARRARLRVREIQESLPDTLDLLVVCVEGGMGIDAALVRVANEQAEGGLLIGFEFRLMTQEIQAGIARREALTRMANRVGVEDLSSLVTFLTQTEELGGSIANSLRIYAATMRDKRSQRAEEAARKAAIKLLFPLVFFILPAVLLVVLGPPVVNIIKILLTP